MLVVALFEVTIISVTNYFSLFLPLYKTGTDVSGIDDEIKAGPLFQFTLGLFKAAF